MDTLERTHCLSIKVLMVKNMTCGHNCGCRGFKPLLMNERWYGVYRLLAPNITFKTICSSRGSYDIGHFDPFCESLYFGKNYEKISFLTLN